MSTTIEQRYNDYLDNGAPLAALFEPRAEFFIPQAVRTAIENPRVNTLDLPPVYWDDHIRCDSHQDNPVWRELPNGKVRVHLSDRDLMDLRSRALYYVEIELDREYFGLKASARATLKAVDKFIKEWREAQEGGAA